METTVNNVGSGFEDIMAAVKQAQAAKGEFSMADTLAIQQSVFHYTIYQETVSKIASKSANAINDVMKAQ
ncbi:EscI/YscI/HrpB family type III secretion system inner rod protein [Vibrio aquaticus]|uniref:EscI/YscI/HrpB family type III secretion system inner rod protein n=1 Tax=Vibrio aquaticus TaxID=2496559 RepID=A0A432CZA6_9VIBR|nr:EscI/YscI/HrpB family type III secretion system inner rod protein [Vibrio aquaticus]RTZ16936.1 EscI/YscI/HrpB family type III secretion system inner rod protein [Vibrio aquaticus]